jgi:hypothetical protein
LAWQLNWLDGVAVEHAYWKGEVLGSNLCRESKSLIRDLDLSAQEETDTTLISCFFLLTIFFAPCSNSPPLCTGTSSLAPEKGPDLVSDIDYDIGGYHTPISGHPILVPYIDTILGYHVTNIRTPDIIPDIDPNIRYVVYDIGDMMTRYLVCTRYRYPISGHM